MKKRLALFLAVVFAGSQVAVPVEASAQSSRPEAKVAVVEDLTYGDDNGNRPAARGESSIYKQAEDNTPLDRKVTIRVNNVPIGTFLNSISAQAKINFIMGEEFAGKKVSASLANVTVREALDTLLRVQGLTYQRIGKSDSYVITKRSDEAPDAVTKVYTLNYVSLQPQSSIAQDINKIMPADTTSSSFSTTSSNVNVFDTTSVGGGAGMGMGTGSGMSGSGDGASAILSVIKSVLTKQGKIAVDARTNKLIITDVPEVFPQVENILAELDIKAPQILIEAQVIEVGKGSGLNLGFNWTNEDGTWASASLGGVSAVPWDWLGGSSNFWKWFGADGDGNGEPTYGSNINEGNSEGGISADFGGFSVAFQAMLSKNEARSLGKPKVITMNNNPAIITSSRDASIGTITKETSGASTSSTSGNERRRVGLTLTVTPQVNKEGYVTLTVAPSYSDLIPSETGDSYDTVTRAVSTQVRVKSGQTVVLGGLLQSVEKETVRKVPLLGQIPVIGWLFTNKQNTKSTTDLVIFLTPTVLSE
ncbi:secretin and TonB N-terminal domain-containing protein [Candidatus Proelusimicrobium volucris]|uniref:secretin and TonB N-terminal domain-containing protein n=1 Tax=Candidatus Proelusimicrobium volucris TaxID=3416225 RepID=UPI003D0D72AC